MQALRSFWNSPVGPKTTHFWGPTLNSGFVVQGALEWNRPADKISRNMQMILTTYSCMFMRFAYMVQPRNWFLFTVHTCNVVVQSQLLIKRLKYEFSDPNYNKPVEVAKIPEEQAQNN